MDRYAAFSGRRQTAAPPSCNTRQKTGWIGGVDLVWRSHFNSWFRQAYSHVCLKMCFGDRMHAKQYLCGSY